MSIFFGVIQSATETPPANTLPVNVSPPSISGAVPVGSTLTCDPGEWSGSPTPAITYQWRRGAATISGATGPTYVTTAADQDQSITCRVTASNIVGSANATSSAITPKAAPVATANPVITGTAQVGQTLTVSTGTFSGSTPITYRYQWKVNGVNAGTDQNSYVVATADEGKTVTCVVTASNVVGSASATSNAVTVALLPKIKITYGGSSASGSDALSYTFTAQIGSDAGEDRYAVVCAGGRGGAARSVTGITINGAAGVVLATTGSCDNPQMIARSASPVPSGTSVAVTVTFNGTVSRYGAASYGVRTGKGAPTIFDTIIVAAAAADPSGSIDVDANGGVIASALCGSGSATTTSWTGVTEDCDFSTEGNANRFSAGNHMATAAQSNRPITANFTANNDDSLLAVSLAA